MYLARPVLEKSILTVFNAYASLPAGGAAAGAGLTAVRRRQALRGLLIFLFQERFADTIVKMIPWQNLIKRAMPIGVKARIEIDIMKYLHPLVEVEML